jgi:uncharacterized protein YndB with AHSA1/START domain
LPTTRRSRTISAPADEVWSVVADPHHLPRWWPRVTRVEGVDDDTFTLVLATDKGRGVRADFRVLESDPPHVRSWAQEVEGTPFEGILRLSRTEMTLFPDGAGTRVTIAVRQKLRSFARLGGMLVRRASGRQLDEALERLETVVGR